MCQVYKCQKQVNEAAYNSMLKVNPAVIEGLRKILNNGNTARWIEQVIRKKYGDNNLTATSMICAAYHMESRPELLEVQS